MVQNMSRVLALNNTPYSSLTPKELSLHIGYFFTASEAKVCCHIVFTEEDIDFFILSSIHQLDDGCVSMS